MAEQSGPKCQGLRVRPLLPTLLAMLVSLAGCGDHLGTYRVEDVRRVQALPPGAGALEFSAAEHVEIVLSSTTDLAQKEIGSGIYVDADWCPLEDPDRIVTAGPVGADGSSLYDVTQSQAGPDGRFRYRVYVLPAHPGRAEQPGRRVRIAYDLRRENRDLCLRLFATGYHIAPSISDTIRLEGARVRAVLDQR